ncbi:MAG TPA: hypothetical protein VGM75_13895 [Pseudonocardiaceae bacterium]
MALISHDLARGAIMACALPIALLNRNLPILVASPDDLDVRWAMQLGA